MEGKLNQPVLWKKDFQQLAQMAANAQSLRDEIVMFLTLGSLNLFAMKEGALKDR